MFLGRVSSSNNLLYSVFQFPWWKECFPNYKVMKHRLNILLSLRWTYTQIWFHTPQKWFIVVQCAGHHCRVQWTVFLTAPGSNIGCNKCFSAMKDVVSSSFVMFISRKLKKALKQGEKKRKLSRVYNNLLCSNNLKADSHFLQSIQIT